MKKRMAAVGGVLSTLVVGAAAVVMATAASGSADVASRFGVGAAIEKVVVEPEPETTESVEAEAPESEPTVESEPTSVFTPDPEPTTPPAPVVEPDPEPEPVVTNAPEPQPEPEPADDPTVPNIDIPGGGADDPYGPLPGSSTNG